MKFVKQTKFDDKGNCLGACICSFLDFDIERFPQQLIDLNPKQWLNSVNNCWLEPNFGIKLLPIMGSSGPPDIDGCYIAVGETERIQDVDHAVICYKGKLIWDPHPSNKGLNKDPKYYLIFYRDFYHDQYRYFGPTGTFIKSTNK